MLSFSRSYRLAYPTEQLPNSTGLGSQQLSQARYRTYSNQQWSQERLQQLPRNLPGSSRTQTLPIIIENGQTNFLVINLLVRVLRIFVEMRFLCRSINTISSLSA
jgi:hypothetical protein